MPSRARQQLIVLSHKKNKTKGDILLVRKTGYMNIWVNGKQYYYNSSQKNVNPKDIKIDRIIEDAEAQEQKRLGVIVIRKR